jgi:hypothetical protein
MTGHLISRPAYTAPCTGCRRHILIAIDGGLTVYADPIPLGIHAEIAARLTGRGVYDVTHTLGGKTYLISRDVFRVRASRKYPVIGDHACIPGHHPASGWKLPPLRGHQPRPEIPRLLADTSEIPF